MYREQHSLAHTRTLITDASETLQFHHSKVSNGSVLVPVTDVSERPSFYKKDVMQPSCGFLIKDP